VSAASLPLPSGAATESTLSARLSETDFDTKTGSLTETAPTTDTASSGLNGRLQRIAQRITTLLANFTAAGSPSANVLSIQGVASMTAVKTDGSGVTQPISNASEIADDAAFTVATSKTYPIGYHSVAHGTNPDAADALDAVNPITNRHRVPFMIGGHPNIQTVEYYAAGSTTQTAFKVITVSSGTKIVITMIEALVSNACTVNVKVRVGFGTSVIPTEPSSGATVAGMVLTHGAIAPGSGVVLGNGAGIVAVGGDDEDLILAHGVSTSGDVRLRVSYYTIES
jgi:hypothetical protein